MEFCLSTPPMHSAGFSRGAANIRQENSHFQVDEVLGFELAGEGEHLYIQIRKNGQNTGWVKEQIAASLNISVRDIGHSGLKDRHAITSQWFSIYTPKNEPDLEKINIEGVEILDSKRHLRKLKPGAHEANRFKILLTSFVAETDVVENLLEKVISHGFPNYFGAQRFGHDGNNLSEGWRLLQSKRLGRHKKKSIYLSALRSFLFNKVLISRINIFSQHSNSPQLEGSPEALDTETFDLTGPLWGRGRLKLAEPQAAFEQQVLEPWAELCGALEFSGLSQERRALFVIPGQLSWQWQADDQLELCFSLPPGAYATALLAELAEVTDVRR